MICQLDRQSPRVILEPQIIAKRDYSPNEFRRRGDRRTFGHLRQFGTNSIRPNACHT